MSFADRWDPAAAGVLTLPGGALVRGRRLGGDDGVAVGLSVQLAARRPDYAGEQLWIRWRDFWVPSDPGAAVAALVSAHGRVGSERVEFCCPGGVGRTGTALAAMCVLDGLDHDAAVAWVRRGYHRRAVEVPWQRRFLRRLEAVRA